jgi:hypothetical protein
MKAPLAAAWQVRYFAFESYNLDNGAAIDTLTDREIRASSGPNPFTSRVSRFADTGLYDVYITPSGSKGLNNEMKSK